MGSYEQNFNRCEKKYLLDETVYRRLISLIYDRLQYDKYRKYKICSIYFDTPHYDLIRNSIEKPLYKEKLRLRSYGIPDSDDAVFLEIKKKFSGTVYKRRCTLSYSAAADLCKGKIPEPDESQIFREACWMISRYGLQPMVYLSYDRLAMTGKDDPGLRITFDTGLRWRISNLNLADGDLGMYLMPEGNYIMEIKTSGAMPLWLAAALSSLHIYPTGFSKYGAVYKENLSKLISKTETDKNRKHEIRSEPTC